MIKVKVPATSANMGAGFDSLGIALGLYNYVYAEEAGDGLNIEILDDSAQYLVTDERNLVYRSMMAVFDKVSYKPKGIHLKLENNIMITRGLGSSSAGIVSGLLAANKLCGARLSKNELLNIATEIEGHPDNVAPAILGGMTVTARYKDRVFFDKNDIPSDLRFAAFVPDFYLATKLSRSILPKNIPMTDAVFNLSRSALLVSSIMSGKYENLRAAVDDRLHQRYRKKLVPHIDSLFRKAYGAGALGVYLSGAGPTVVAIVSRDNERFEEKLQKYIDSDMSNWQLYMLEADNIGAVAYDCKTEG